MDITSFSWRDIIDVLLVTLLLYQIIVRIKGTRALPAIYALVLIVLVYFFSREMGIYTLQWLLENFLASLFIIIIILFQKDIRQILTEMGLNQIRLPFLKRKNTINDDVINEILAACKQMTNNKIGALIVLERRSPLGDILRGGVTIDARISRALLVSIFFPNTPLHDGAVVIANGRLAAAGCILPLTVQPNLQNDHGTRHRAAIGITEESDALAIVVSEERGSISVAINGQLYPCSDSAHLRRLLSFN